LFGFNDEKDTYGDSVRAEKEVLMPAGDTFTEYEKDGAWLHYLSGKVAASLKNIRKGQVLRFGFCYGYNYAMVKHMAVPNRYGKAEQYPLTMLTETPLACFLKKTGLSLRQNRGIEQIRFENGLLVVNHSSLPFPLTDGKDIISSQPLAGNDLPGHSAAFIKHAGKKCLRKISE